MSAARGSNQTPPFIDIDLFTSDRALTEAVARAGHSSRREELSAFGREWGSGEAFELGRLANEHPPVLESFDARGNRRDEVLFHPAYHELMARSMRAGLHGSTWDGEPHVVRAAKLFMAYQVESGHICPLTMTHAAGAALMSEPALATRWIPAIRRLTYDPRLRPWTEKTGVTVGMGMTERQGGTDVRTNETQAVRHADAYEITGEKWFMSAPMCDAFLVLAQAPDGLTCFLVPRFRPDGAINGLHFRRLKDKLGNRSNASSEVEFVDAHGDRVGEEGHGIRTILRMVQLTRVDCAVASAGLMRFSLAHAVHHAARRVVFGKTLLAQPAMRTLIADLALEVEAMIALVFRLVRALDAAPGDPAEEAYARLLTPAVKYLVCKSAPGFVYECMECLGGNGYIEDWPLARAYREAPVNAIWEGSGNVMALDILRAARRAPDVTRALIQSLSERAGVDPRDLAALLEANDLESGARRIADRLARLAAADALRESDPAMAEAYVQSRLRGEARVIYGAAQHGAVEARLIDRILPIGA